MSDYAFVTNGTVQSVGLPASARRLDTGAWVLGLANAPDALKAACGYLPLVDASRPADTATDTHDRSVELVAGVPTVVWTTRPWTPSELASRTAATNEATLRTQAQAALTANATFLAIGAPTNAQVLAQTRALTQQASALIRLELNALDAI